MKRIIAMLAALIMVVGLMAGCSNNNANEPASETPEASNTDSADAQAPSVETIQLDVGAMEIYDFGGIKLHAYETKDPISDESFILETADELIVIELIGFYNNIEEFKGYLDGLGKPLNSVIVAYHPAGGDAYPDTDIYADESLGEIALVAGFVEAFGADAYNGSVPETFELVEPGAMTIGGVDFNVIATDDAFDLEIPAINVYFTHMLGSNTHNILGSADHIDAMLDEMKALASKNYSLILTSHDIPRTGDIATEKITYLEQVKSIVAESESAEEFTQAMQAAFPNYGGENYLGMSAGALFGNSSATPIAEKAMALLKSLETGDQQAVLDYMSEETYIQHTTAADGRENMLGIVERLSSDPASSVNTVRAFTDGDYVFLHTCSATKYLAKSLKIVGKNGTPEQ